MKPAKTPEGWKKRLDEKRLIIWLRIKESGKKVIEMTAMKDDQSFGRKGEWYVYATYTKTQETVEWVTHYISGGRKEAIKYAVKEMEEFDEWEEATQKKLKK